MGMGIHGEPGIWRDKLRPADAIADEMVSRLLQDPVPNPTQRVSVLVNSLGATPLEELFIVYRRVKSQLDKAGIRIVRPLVGHYVTSMEMAGISISVSYLDDELDALLAAPCALPVLEGLDDGHHTGDDPRYPQAGRGNGQGRRKRS